MGLGSAIREFGRPSSYWPVALTGKSEPGNDQSLQINETELLHPTDDHWASNNQRQLVWVVDWCKKRCSP
jgi:hypothetical protein